LNAVTPALRCRTLPSLYAWLTLLSAWLTLLSTVLLSALLQRA
jgi:hypothetical protein